ncbi:hypothetical protein ACFYW6_31165 [Streptomyces sp. NPDC002659]|uniref:hypothetical protein n=1 Tax=Streptomyces sp. NPDC002659 TaxID=3364656 RepID=UPI0036AA4BF9
MGTELEDVGPQASMLLLMRCVVGVCVFNYTSRTHCWCLLEETWSAPSMRPWA